MASLGSGVDIPIRKGVFADMLDRVQDHIFQRSSMNLSESCIEFMETFSFPMFEILITIQVIYILINQ
jgi:hypothetical protein